MKLEFLNKKVVLILAIVAGSIILSIYPTYLLARFLFNRHFDSWGEKLVELEKKGLLSKEFGAAWQDILATEALEKEISGVVESEALDPGSYEIIDGVPVKDYPSLSIVALLNEVNKYSNTIEILDRRDRKIATIKTDHTRAKTDEFPPILMKALIAAEDGRFYENMLGFEFRSFVRAGLRALLRTITTFTKFSPRGTSTITQQVAKFLVSQLDESGHRMVSRSVDRKVRELRISCALHKMYSPDEILEVYMNHCITSDFGLIGVKDIALGLFNKELNELSDAECIYIARMVKWGRNLHSKIAHQCHVDMPRIGDALEWPKQRQEKILQAIDELSFEKPKQIMTEYGHLVDLANEFWLRYLKKNNGNEPENDDAMDIINPNSLIRKKGNLAVRLTIDLPLQKYLQKLVDSRGYGSDTIIYTDVRIGSFGKDVKPANKPKDTLRLISVIDTTTRFSESHAEFYTTLEKGDTLVTNVRYRKKKDGIWRRSCYYYTRRKMKVDGQYFSYCIIDSRSGKLLAYYSRDKIGSRLACLLRNPVPNGSSTAKPILNALNFDLGIFPPYAKWSDSLPVNENVPWKRKIIRRNGKPFEVVFEQSAVRGQGYRMHNHNYVFEGCQHIFNHLATSNNIFGVESIYRLNKKLFDNAGNIISDAFPFVQYLYRINALEKIKDELKMKNVTGVRLYKELARIAGIDADSMIAYGRKIAISDSLYSVALGTLEMTLYEQAHIFNVLYHNDLIERPVDHMSLIIDSININGVSISVADCDTVKRYHPFAEVNNIRPTYLGMHKRLVSNRWDGLNEYDIPYTVDTSDSGATDGIYSYEDFMIDEPLSNFAKSGTTDDVLRPFNVDVTSKRRTNYGLWNAVIRIDLSKLSNDSIPEIRDVTIACIGECNKHYTGARDGKSLHKFVSRDFLKAAGKKAPQGFYTQYERYLKRVTPDSEMYCGEFIADDEKEGEDKELD